MRRAKFQVRLRTLFFVLTIAALLQPLLMRAYEATQPRAKCEDILKPINTPIGAQ